MKCRKPFTAVHTVLKGLNLVAFVCVPGVPGVATLSQADFGFKSEVLGKWVSL